MKVVLTSPVEGGKPGDERDVTDERGAWLIANGYAVAAGASTKSAPQRTASKKTAASTTTRKRA